MKKIAFIVNPTAGKGKSGKSISKIENYCKKMNIDFSIHITQCVGHATALTNNCVDTYSHIVAVGGDGTLNEVINGKLFMKDIRVGVIPVGSGNDFAIALKSPKSLEENLALILNEKSYRPINIGDVEYLINNEEIWRKRKFINSCGIGFDAKVAFFNQDNKILSGTSSYIVAILKALVNYDYVSFDAKIDENQAFSSRNLFVSIGNGVTAGSGLYLTPNAKIDDDFLDYTFVDVITRNKLIRSLPKAFFNKLHKLKEVKFGKFKNAEFILNNPYFLHTDGEALSSNVKEIKIRVFDKKINFATNL